jgi:hypothetical protein
MRNRYKPCYNVHTVRFVKSFFLLYLNCYTYLIVPSVYAKRWNLCVKRDEMTSQSC